jgi:hypothetical protein
MDDPYHLPWQSVLADWYELLSCELMEFPAAVILYSKFTQPTVMTEITHGRQGPALLENASSMVHVYKIPTPPPFPTVHCTVIQNPPHFLYKCTVYIYIYTAGVSPV